MNTEKIDRCISENQLVGDGNGWACLRDLFETPDGKRYSIRKTEWHPCRSPADRPFKWEFIKAKGNA